MSGNKIKAVIRETDGEKYYNVLLNTVPKPGEKISLYSHLDQTTGYEATHNYEVINISHEIHDVTDKEKASLDGHHEVTLIVEPI